MSAQKPKMCEQSAYAQKPWLKHYDFWVPGEMNFPQQPIHQILNQAALQFTDRPAVAFRDVRLTFGEIKAEVDRLATALARLGIGSGDRIGVMLPNCPQYLVSFFAIVRLGAIVVNVNPIYTAAEVATIARDSGIRAMITLDVLAELVEKIRLGSQIQYIITTNLDVYSTGLQASRSPIGTLSLSDLIANVEGPDVPRVV